MLAVKLVTARILACIKMGNMPCVRHMKEASQFICMHAHSAYHGLHMAGQIIWHAADIYTG